MSLAGCRVETKSRRSPIGALDATYALKVALGAQMPMSYLPLHAVAVTPSHKSLPEWRNWQTQGI